VVVIERVLLPERGFLLECVLLGGRGGVCVIAQRELIDLLREHVVEVLLACVLLLECVLLGLEHVVEVCEGSATGEGNNTFLCKSYFPL
jgi:hypothetical protein